MEAKSFITLGTLLTMALVTTGHAKSYMFVPPGETDPAILLDVDISIEIKAMVNGMEVAGFVGGTNDYPIIVAGLKSDRTFIELQLQGQGISWGLIFKEKSLDDITVDRIVQFTPNLIFPPFAKLNKPLLFEDKGNTEYQSAIRSFQCDQQSTRRYESAQTIEGDVKLEVYVTVSNLKVQAFHIEDGKFSPADHCSGDHESIPTALPATTKKTTTKSPINPGPQPGPGGPMQMRSFIVNNTVDNTSIICVSMEGRVGFDVSYNSYSGFYRTTKKTLRLGIPVEAHVEGDCFLSSGTQRLSITFFNNWVVDFIFSINVAYSRPSEDGDNQSKLDYSIESVSLRYNIDDEERFPQAYRSEGSNFTISMDKEDNLPRKKAATGFFSCDSEKRYRMSEDVALVLTDFRFKAFIKDQDVGFYGMPNHCEEDMVTIGASTLVIAVGCLVLTFSLVIFIALVALITTKCKTRRKRRKYISL